MNSRIRITFLLLVITQAFHALEEYFGKLWEVYAPAKFICSLVGTNPRTGFLVINIAFLSFSLLYWWSLVKREPTSFEGFIWLWIVLEIVNISGHISWTIYEGAYTPGVVTAVILLLVVISLFRQLRRANSNVVRNNKN